MDAQQTGQRFDAVFSDMDSTLIDSEPVYDAGYDRVMKRFGIELSEEEIQDTLGVALKERYERYKDRLPGQMDFNTFSDAIITEYFLNAHKVPLMPGTKEFLRDLDANGLGLAVVSNARRMKLDTNIGLLGPEAELFSFSVSGDDVNRRKPFPDPYLAAAARMGVDPSRALVLEDSPAGVKAGKAAGMTVIQIQSNPALVMEEADLVVKDWADPRLASFIGLEASLTAVARTGRVLESGPATAAVASKLERATPALNTETPKPTIDRRRQLAL